MARFNLQKGDRFKLAKGEDLEKIRVDLTWESEADLDAEAFLLGNNGLIVEDTDFVYYNSAKRGPIKGDGETEDEYFSRVAEIPYDRNVYGSKKNWQSETAPLSFDESVVGSFDDLGSDDSGESIRVNLSKVRPGIDEIVFTVTIHGDDVTFKDVKNAKLVITNIMNGEELCAYELNEQFTSETAMVAGALRLNDDGEWEFEAIGNGYDGGLQTLIDLYA